LAVPYGALGEASGLASAGDAAGDSDPAGAVSSERWQAAVNSITAKASIRILRIASSYKFLVSSTGVHPNSATESLNGVRILKQPTNFKPNRPGYLPAGSYADREKNAAF
jgi:hypothetical protein